MAETTETETTETETAAERGTLSCSFCGLPQERVKKLIAGPAGVCICNECVELCNDIITDDEVEQPKPSEEQVAAALAAMLKNRALTARTAEQHLEKIVRQARSKGLSWDSIAESLGMTGAEAESRFDSP